MQADPHLPGAPLSEQSLRARLTAYAHDSMRGRKAGTSDNDRATEYIAAEFRKLGLEPAGDNGTFFQTLILRTRIMADTSHSFAVNGKRLRLGIDYVPRYNGERLWSLDDAQAIYGGVWSDTTALIAGDSSAGKLVVISMREGEFAIAKAQIERRLGNAAGIAVANLDLMPQNVREFFSEALPDPAGVVRDSFTPPFVHITSQALTQIFGAPARELTPGDTAPPLGGSVRFLQREYSARNVVAILRGSDAVMRNQFIMLGSHNDHEGAGRAVDRDSLRAYNKEVHRRLQRARIHRDSIPTSAIVVNIDSIRRLHPAPRMDSIFNGADDDGSGTVATLEVARALAALPPSARPRRSIIFISHTAEEDGLIGSDYFSRKPTIVMDSVVAHINLDMIGRGGVEDETNGGPGYLQVIGSRRLSSEFGALIDSVAGQSGHGWKLDYSFDQPGHPEQLFCRSDHFSYARLGIPVAFFSTGTHADYHQLTDEADLIDYTKLSSVSHFVRDLIVHLADRDDRIVIDKPRPDPTAPCAG